MKSPCCRAPAPVLNSRPTDAGNRIRRRRCASCGQDTTTVEYVITDPEEEQTR